MSEQVISRVPCAIGETVWHEGQARIVTALFGAMEEGVIVWRLRLAGVNGLVRWSRSLRREPRPAERIKVETGKLYRQNGKEVRNDG